MSVDYGINGAAQGSTDQDVAQEDTAQVGTDQDVAQEDTAQVGTDQDVAQEDTAQVGTDQDVAQEAAQSSTKAETAVAQGSTDQVGTDQNAALQTTALKFVEGTKKAAQEGTDQVGTDQVGTAEKVSIRGDTGSSSSGGKYRLTGASTGEVSTDDSASDGDLDPSGDVSNGLNNTSAAKSDTEESGYTANKMVQFIAKIVKEKLASIGSGQAFAPMTIDNSIIYSVKPSTEGEQKNPPPILIADSKNDTVKIFDGQAGELAQGEGNSDALSQAQDLIKDAKNAVDYAKQVLKDLKNENSIATLSAAITSMEDGIAQAQNALASADESQLGNVDLSAYAGYSSSLRTLAASLKSMESQESQESDKGLSALGLMKALGLDFTVLNDYVKISGFEKVADILAFFKSKGLTTMIFSDLVKTLADVQLTIHDFIAAGVLENTGVGAFVVNLSDSQYGLQASFETQGKVYTVGGAIVLSNGAQIQIGDPQNPEDTSQKFGMVEMDDENHCSFFSTVGSEALGLFPGEMLVNRYAVIANKEEGQGPLVYYFDENGCATRMGLLSDVDPDGELIGNQYEAAGYTNGLPLEEDLKTFPKNYLGHNFVYSVITKPTCTKTGLELIECKNCMLKMSKPIPVDPNAHESVIRGDYDSTCSEEGYTGNTYCLYCNKTLQRGTPIAMKDHSWSTEWTKGETTHWKECTVCHTKKPGTEATHNWGENEGWSADTATCTAGGTQKRTCSVCGREETQATDLLGHDWEDGWTQGEETHWHSCSRCPEKKDEAAHDWVEQSNTATCAAAGKKTFKCSVCEATKEEDAAALEHTWSTEWTKGEDKHWHECTVCHNAKKDEAAHDWGNGWSADTATCWEGGSQTRTCSVCGREETRNTGIKHTWSTEWTKGGDTHWHTCTVCGDAKNDEAPHTFENGVCTICGEPESGGIQPSN